MCTTYIMLVMGVVRTGVVMGVVRARISLIRQDLEIFMFINILLTSCVIINAVTALVFME